MRSRPHDVRPGAPAMKPLIAALIVALFGASSAPATAEDPVAIPAIPRSRGVY